MKLDTTEAVLEAASILEFQESGYWELAQRIAYAMRVLALVEWSASRESGYAPDVRDIHAWILEQTKEPK